MKEWIDRLQIKKFVNEFIKNIKEKSIVLNAVSKENSLKCHTVSIKHQFFLLLESNMIITMIEYLKKKVLRY